MVLFCQVRPNWTVVRRCVKMYSKASMYFTLNRATIPAIIPGPSDHSGENQVAMKKVFSRPNLLLPLSLAVIALHLAAAEKEGDAAKIPPPADRKVDFVKDIRPILSQRCHSCHGAKKAQAGLRLNGKNVALAGGDNGKVIVPGKSLESKLIRLVAGVEDDAIMPPEGEPLSKEQIGLLRAWIDQGADWPEAADARDAAGRDHWAYQPPVRPALPAVKNSKWCRTPIDHFVLARLEREGLSPAAELDSARLIRRVSLDLTGLPPAIAEIDAFLADKSAGAYEKVVDRLLDSPAYGERWARMWLDMARYADTRGYEKDSGRSIWRYRDWVIDAFNRNLAFDQFTIEQLAGDMLPDATLDQKIATGFHRNTMNNTEGGTDDEEFRTAAVMDRVETTFGVWMATTFNCCQCHTHKYDPFTQREYYQFLAFLNNTADADRDDESPTLAAPTPEQESQTNQLQAEIARHEALLAADTRELAAAQAEWERTLGSQSVPWMTLDPATAAAASGTTLTKQDDRSLLAGGTAPETEKFTIVAATDLQAITAIRLEMLVHDSLPAKGPGRAPNGNFVLTDLRLTVGLKDSAETKPVPLHNASADHEQPSFPAANAIDQDPKTGWAIGDQMGKNHEAIFELKEPLSLEAGQLLTFVLDQQYGGKHTLGRLRLSVTNAKPPVRVNVLPEPIRQILAVPADKRLVQQQSELKAYYRSFAPLLKPARDKIAELKAALPKVPTTLVLQELPQPRETHICIRGSFLSKGEKVEPGVPAVLHPLPKDRPANRLTMARWVVSPENPLTARVAMNRFWEQLFGRGLVETSEDFGTRGDRPSHPELLDWLAVEFMHPEASPPLSKGGLGGSGEALSRNRVPGSASGITGGQRAPIAATETSSATPPFPPLLRGGKEGWDIKHVLKLMVMSATYGQSARVTPELIERDPYNRLFARGPRFRLEAEMLRDQALAASGLLSKKMHGPSMMPPQPEGVWSVPYSGDRWVTSAGEDKYRRALYTFWRRSAPYPAFMTFDAPSREFCVLRRPRSNTPLQALTILNDPAYVEAAQALARRGVSEGGPSPESRATHIFRRCLSRAPEARELARLVVLYQRELDRYRQDQPAAAEMATSHLGAAPTEMNVSELAAWTVVANVVLNLDETLTK